MENKKHYKSSEKGLEECKNIFYAWNGILTFLYCKNWKRKGTLSIGSIEEIVMLKLFSLEWNLKRKTKTFKQVDKLESAPYLNDELFSS